MNIYADRGNLLVLERRCRGAGSASSCTASGLGEPLDPEAHDLFYLGGGQDRDQRLCAEDLLETKREALHAAAAAGRWCSACAAAISCSGTPTRSAGARSRASGCSTCDTVREDATAPDRQRRDRGRRSTGGRRREAAARARAGFENHGGRTHLGDGAAAARARAEGLRQRRPQRLGGRERGNTIGTYLHGPLLPKNVWFADWLIARALRARPRRAGAAR